MRPANLICSARWLNKQAQALCLVICVAADTWTDARAQLQTPGRHVKDGKLKNKNKNAAAASFSNSFFAQIRIKNNLLQNIWWGEERCVMDNNHPRIFDPSHWGGGNENEIWLVAEAQCEPIFWNSFIHFKANI